jgi:ribonuclease R
LCDLVIHHQIKDFLNKRNPQFSKEELSKISEQATKKEQLADDGEKEVDYKYKQIFMQDKLGEEYKAIIKDLNSTGLIVELYKYPITGIVPIDRLGRENYEFYSSSMILIGTRSREVFKLAQKIDVKLIKLGNPIIFDIVR